MLWSQAREQTLDPTTLLKETVQLGLAMSAETDLERLLDLVVAGAQRFTRAEGGTVYLLHSDGLEFAVVKNDVLTRRYGAAEVRGRFRGRRLPLDSSSLAGHVALTGRPLSIPDTAAISPTESYRLDVRFDRENQYDTRSVLVLPLTDPRGTVLGVLQLVNALDDNAEVVAFDPDIQEVVALLAAYAAAAIRNAQLAAYSLNDHLTGAFNRRYVTLRLDEEISRTKRTGEPLSFALIDIDLLKEINDQHGHPQGDVVIRAVAQLLINQSRAYTVVARYGGDEFAILLPSTPKAGAVAYAERMKRIVASYPFTPGPVTISIGTATMPGDADTRDDLIAAADRSLYRAKQQGRNRVGD
jgi:diguanylate cyclase (GGDEF)-like protein